MYVCVCHGVSDKQLKRALESGVRTFEQLQACTGVATCCGACEPCAREILADNTLDSPAPAHQAA
jgi:bacterioferritin-associated ferredoxin